MSIRIFFRSHVLWILNGSAVALQSSIYFAFLLMLYSHIKIFFSTNFGCTYDVCTKTTIISYLL